MLLMITIGYVFSYLIPTKQKSVEFPIYSNQALFIAQSGLEFAVRYCENNGWRGATDGGTFDLDRLDNIWRDLGNGRFTIVYDRPANTLTSTGQITSSTENRVVQVSNFSPFLRLLFTTPAPQFTTGTRRALFYIINVRVPDVTLCSFSASWTAQNNRTLQRIFFDGTGGGDRRYNGDYVNGSPAVNFNDNGNSFTISPTPPNASTSVYIYWSQDLGTNSHITITFYTGTLGTGDAYTFDLDSAGNGL